MTQTRNRLSKNTAYILQSWILAVAATAAVTAIAPPAAAQSFYEEQGKLIRAPQAVGALGADLFGDQVNFYTGSLEFIQNDVSLPGNNSLPVAIGRRLIAGSYNDGGRLFGRWDLEIPHLHGIYSDTGWINSSAFADRRKRCSQFSKPPIVAGSYGTGGLWSGIEYWHGSFLYVPGVGDQEILRRFVANPHVPADGAAEQSPYTIYPLVTRNLWAFKCLSSLASDTSADKSSGEGFLAISPEGTQYRFDWMVSRSLDSLEKGTTAPALTAALSSATGTDGPSAPPVSNAADSGDGSVLSRSEIWILPTLITDRYGNTVTYTYNAANPWQLQNISASDGRSISLTYVPTTNQVASVSDGTRTWAYTYNGVLPGATLDTVTLPDSSQWHLLGIDSLMADLQYLGPPRCNDPGVLNPATMTGSMTHPSGAIGEFTLTTTPHARAGVYLQCMNTGTVGEYASRPKDFATNALTKKVITGPGLPAMTWTTTYPEPEGSWAPCSGCVTTKTVEVLDPAGDITRYTFGTLDKQTEGLLQRTEVVDAANGSLRSTVTLYRDPAVGPFPSQMGVSDQGRGDGDMTSRLQVAERRTVSQQGVDFTWQVNGVGGIDTKGRPVDVTRSSSLANSRTERTTYFDQLDKWVLSQVASVTEASTGAVPVANAYDASTGTLSSVTRFGRLDRSMSYYGDGTLQTRSDGAGHVTTFSNYMRGIPQNVSYADGSAESAYVNNIGVITWLIDAVGYRTDYQYDLMGRLARIIRPTSDSVNWTDSVIGFVQPGSVEYGLDATHWRQTVTTGNATSVSYMDGFWRPVLTRVYDSADEGSTSKMTVRQFDHRGQPTFESYPQRTISYASDRPTGVATEYDALGRVMFSRADAEDHTVSTTATDYLAGFQKRVTNPLGFATTTSFQAFDEPREDAALTINAPEALTVTIARDIFGQPLAVTRSGNGASATRSFVYDDQHRLCKTIEPETGATLRDYDAANNISWRATGLALTSAACDRASVPGPSKTTFGYDTLNRLTSTAYGDGSPGITRTYYADGMPWTVSSDAATWTTNYNKRRQPVSETLSFEGLTYTLSRSYDGGGNVIQFNYPTASEGNPITANSVAYAPNALGEWTRAGNFATAVSYHPNGAIAGFTYGNGKIHALTQNDRKLPQLASDTGVVQDSYTYDANGNVKAITDQLPGNRASRTMDYDGLDRLKGATAPGMWGSASYSYDTLDNITNSTIGSRISTYAYDAQNRLNNVGSTVASYAFLYSYDAQGNITGRGTQSYTFDLANRMTSAAGKATYRYDGYGHRLKSTAADGTVTVSVYSPAGQLLYVTQRGGPGPAATTEYIYLHNHQIAEVKR